MYIIIGSLTTLKSTVIIDNIFRDTKMQTADDDGDDDESAKISIMTLYKKSPLCLCVYV